MAPSARSAAASEYILSISSSAIFLEARNATERLAEGGTKPESARAEIAKEMAKNVIEIIKKEEDLEEETSEEV